MTDIILLITGIISVAAFYYPGLMDRFIFNPYHIRQSGEYYRFLTSGFLHANWIHLLVNVIVLWSFGRHVEFFYQRAFGLTAGPVLYIALYLIAIIVSEIPTYLKHREHPSYASLGASGAVSAIVFASILFNPMAMLYLMGIIPIPGIVFGVLYLFYSAYMARQSADNINHDAHFYGALFGITFTVVFHPKSVLIFLEELTGFF